jgi:2-acylglycerol O-acyltransferase 2
MVVVVVPPDLFLVLGLDRHTSSARPREEARARGLSTASPSILPRVSQTSRMTWANDLNYAAAVYLLFGGVPATLLAALVAARNRLPRLAWPLLAAAYAAMYRRDAGRKFGKDSDFFRRLVHKLVLPLFQEQGGRVILDGHIDPDGVYCVAGAPHGVVPLYLMAITDWFRYGPERKSPIALGANVIFKIPGLREVFLNFALPGTPENFAALVRSGRSVSVVPGGVSEMMLCEPGNRVKLVTKHSGFIKLCLQHGVSIIPVFAFGENNMWAQSRLPQFMSDAISRATGGFYPFIPSGEHACIPRRGPVVVVSAAPMAMPQIDNPSDADVEFHRARFYSTISALIEKHQADLGFAHLAVEFLGMPELNVGGGGKAAKL